MTVDEEFATLLHNLGFGIYNDTTSATIFVEAMPQGPDEAIAVTVYGGVEADAKHGYDEVRWQVRCRGTANPSVSKAKAQAVYDRFHGYPENTALPGGTVLSSCIGIQSGPVPMGRDGNGRFEHSVNFRAELRRVTINRV
jgi:hypothetical protein